MGLQGQTPVEAILERGLWPVTIAAGAVVLAGFFFPSAIGGAIPGIGWLIIALLFFGSLLGYLAVLPADNDRPRSGSGRETLTAIRRGTWQEWIRTLRDHHDFALLAIPLVGFGLFFGLYLLIPGTTGDVVDQLRGFILGQFGWVFLGVMFLSVLYCGFLLLGPWGEIRLGGEDATPGYTYPTYFALVFTAGIAAGIVFWGPAEALYHYQSPPPYFDAGPGSEAAVIGALTYAFFHWGVSAWSAYTVLGVPIAYFVFQRGAPLRVSAILTPFLGVEGLQSIPARIVDLLAIFATIGGIATSVALISQQFLTGITYQWGVPTGAAGSFLFVAGLASIYILSATTGLHRGIRRIAAVNIGLFGLFLVVMAVISPSQTVLDHGRMATAEYVTHFVSMSLFFGPEWVARWTSWNWSWWFSWAPFAGLFLAALSRGRTIRNVVFTGVVATSAATISWFLVIGATSLHVQRSGGADILGAMAARNGSVAVAGFAFLDSLPLSELLVFVFLGLILVFIVSSADTSTLVVTILATDHGVTPRASTIGLWGTIQGIVALSVILVGGGDSLQAVAVLTGGPFALLALIAMGGLSFACLRDERDRVSPIRRLWNRIPTVGMHHDIQPPDEES